MLDGGGVEKPMLGRYEVEKELGKGAMGIVYLGKDPKISRVVAIKTMALAQEFEEDELEPAEAEDLRLAIVLTEELGVNAAGVEVVLHLRRRMVALERRRSTVA